MGLKYRTSQVQRLQNVFQTCKRFQLGSPISFFTFPQYVIYLCFEEYYNLHEIKEDGCVYMYRYRYKQIDRQIDDRLILLFIIYFFFQKKKQYFNGRNNGTLRVSYQRLIKNRSSQVSFIDSRKRKQVEINVQVAGNRRMMHDEF